MDRVVYIYALYQNGNPIYVGASFDLKKRMANHMNTTLKTFENKHEVEIRQLEVVVNCNEAHLFEKKWYDFFIDKGYALLNKEKGGFYTQNKWLLWRERGSEYTRVIIDSIKEGLNNKQISQKIGFSPQMTICIISFLRKDYKVKNRKDLPLVYKKMLAKRLPN